MSSAFLLVVRAALILVGGVSTACTLGAQGSPPAAGVIAGRVLDSAGAPVASARVTAAGLDRVAVTNDSGRFVLRLVPPGRRPLLVTQIGYLPARLAVELRGGDTARVEVGLQRTTVTLSSVQVTATPTSRDPLAVAQSTTAVAGAELERSLGSTLGATLARQPGVSARYDGPGASVPIIRGLTGDRVLMLQDGLRTGDLSSTAPDHGVTVDPNAAARIEIVRGPAALLYGNNALGGVVNVISEDLPAAVPARLTGSSTLSAESVIPGGGVSAEVAAPLGRFVVVRARAGAREHDDVRVGGGWPLARLDNTYSRNRHGVVGVGAIGDRASGGVAYRAYDFRYGLPSRDPNPASFVVLDGRRHELLARGELAGGRGPVDGLRVEGTAQWYAHDELASDGSVATALGLRTQSVQAVARTGPLWVFRDGAVGVSGLFRQNRIGGPQALMPPTATSGAGAFAFQEIPLRAAPWAGPTALVRLPLGLRYDRYAVESEATERFGPARRRLFRTVSGSAGLSVPLAEGASLGVNLARAVRTPTVEELFSLAGHAGTGAFERGDPSLAAETNAGADAVLRVERRRASAQLSAYRSRIGNYIALYPAVDAAGAPRDTVVGDGLGGTKRLPLHVASQRAATLRGVEGSASVALPGHVVLGAMGDLVRAADAGGAPLPFIPPARLGLSARYDDGRWSLGTEARRAFAQRRVPPGELRTPAYTLADLHAGLRLTAGAHAHSLTLRLDNAADALYRDAASEIKDFAPNPGRNVALVYKVWW